VLRRSLPKYRSGLDGWFGRDKATIFFLLLSVASQISAMPVRCSSNLSIRVQTLPRPFCAGWRGYRYTERHRNQETLFTLKRRVKRFPYNGDLQSIVPRCPNRFFYYSLQYVSLEASWGDGGPRRNNRSKQDVRSVSCSHGAAAHAVAL